MRISVRRSYGEVAAEMGGRLFDVLLPAIDRLWWDRERLAAHRLAALRETLAFAVERSRWHAKRMGGINTQAMASDDLSSLPVMTKGDLMASWDEIVTDPRLSLASAREHLSRLDKGPAFLLDEYHVLTTGGSTGEPGVFCWSRDEILGWMTSGVRWMLAGNLSPSQRVAFVGARSIRHPTAALGLLASAMAGVEPALVPVDQPIQDIVRRLNELQPDAIFVVSSLLPALVEATRTGTLKIDLGCISAGGDELDRDVAAAAAEVLDAAVLESYPTTDVGFIAYQAPGEGGLYINEDLLVVEPVDEHDRPVPAGEDSHHLLVTSLYQRTLPLIRYCIEDRVRVEAVNGRHAAYRKITAIDGRTDDLFVYRTTTVHPHVFRAVFARHACIRDYRVTQTSSGAEVELASSGPLEPAAVVRELAEALGRAGVPDAQVGVSVYEELERTGVGKRVRFVPVSIDRRKPG